MNRLALSFVLLLAGNLALADTHYNDLATRFAAGKASTLENAAGWNSGRCYNTNNPDRAEGTILVVETRDGGTDGPIFKKHSKLLIIQHPQGYSNPEMFDKPNAELTGQIEAFVDNAFAQNNFSDTFDGDNALSSTFNNGRGLVRFDLRTDGQYAFARASVDATGYEIAYCYFFNKVRNKN